MRKILLSLTVCILAFGGWASAFAGWDKAEWGMTLEQVEKALGVTFAKIDAKPNQYGLLNYAYQGQEAGLVCTITDSGLERVGLAFVGEDVCTRQYIQLLETYAKPERKTEDAGKLITAAWAHEGTRIDFLWGKNMGGENPSMCTVNFSPLPVQ